MRIKTVSVFVLDKRRGMPMDKWKYELIDWLHSEGFQPWSFLSFTFKDEINDDRGRGLLKNWLDDVNTFVMGKHYKREYKHSYFSYVYVEEWQSRGVIHFHMLIDNAIPFKYAKRVWMPCGWLDIDRVKNEVASLRYILKYAMKGRGDVVTWLLKKSKPVVRFASIPNSPLMSHPARPVEQLVQSRFDTVEEVWVQPELMEN